MNFWQYLDKNPSFAITLTVLLSVIAIAIVAATIFLLIRFNLIWKWYREAKKEADFSTLSKSIKRELKKKQHSFVFASSIHDNDKAYKDIMNLFDQNGKIQYVNKSHAANFDKIFGKYDIVVYQVSNADANKSNSRHKSYDSGYRPLYKLIANYCAGQQKQCILQTSEHIDIEGIDPVYITTVNYYAKLRETLYILLYFAP